MAETNTGDTGSPQGGRTMIPELLPWEWEALANILGGRVPRLSIVGGLAKKGLIQFDGFRYFVPKSIEPTIIERMPKKRKGAYADV